MSYCRIDRERADEKRKNELTACESKGLQEQLHVHLRSRLFDVRVRHLNELDDTPER
jgi:hypothetical protein